MTWRVHTELSQDRMIHVWPEDDLIAHDIESLACVCRPKLEVTGEQILVSHSALDGRSQ